MKNNKSKTEAMAAWYEKNKSEPGQYDDYAARLDQVGLWAFGDGYDAGQASAFEWIPVSERLPDEGDDVYFITRSLNVSAVDICTFNSETGFWYDDVVAWMPLPPPYKLGIRDSRIANVAER